ncbi:MAG: hypothetical protein ABR568_24410, partial [Pyrinomonadaceae bacterium]
RDDCGLGTFTAAIKTRLVVVSLYQLDSSQACSLIFHEEKKALLVFVIFRVVSWIVISGANARSTKSHEAARKKL